MDMQCGPLDRSLLNQQDDHISTAIWHGVERNRLDVRQLTARQGDWVLQDSQRHLLDAWGFGVFAEPRSVPQNDIALITALVERWRPETNSFHFPFGEMTITLEDVYMILGLPIIGHALTSMELDCPKPYWMRRWEDRRLQDTDREGLWSKRGGVSLPKLRERYGQMRRADEDGYMEQDPVVYTRAYILYIIGGILFPTSSRDIVHPRYLQLIQTTDGIIDYAWGAAVLAYLYRGLCKAANKSCTSLNGCTMLLQLWAYERLLPGRPQIAPGMERVWPRALAWSEPIAIRRFNPHHHTRQYRGDFDSFQLHWLTWEPYARFYMIEDYDQDDDDDLHVACHMALGRIPLIAFEICEYQMPDRVLRQFGILQHIPEPPIDMGFLRTERASSFQRVNHIELLRMYVQEWDAYGATGMPITTEGPYVPISEYMMWYRRVSKMRIAPFVASDPHLIQPRDWYPQQDMADALESAMRMTHAMYLRGPPDWFYELIPDFLGHYDRVYTEWKGLAFDRPTFIRKEQPYDVGERPSPVVEQPPITIEQSQMENDSSAPASSLQTPLQMETTDVVDTPLHASHKRPRDDPHIQMETTDVVDNPLHASHKRPRDDPHIQVDTTTPSSIHASPPPSTQFGTITAPSPSLHDPPPPLASQIATTTPRSSVRTTQFGTTAFSSLFGGPPPPPTSQIVTIDLPLSFRTPPPTPASETGTTTPTSLFSTVPTFYRDLFDIDTQTDKLKDVERGGEERSGDMTRPLKNRKIRWLFANWWGKESSFEWSEECHRGLSYPLVKEQVLRLKPGHELDDDVINAYVELLRIRDNDLFSTVEVAKKYFFMPSYFMPQAGRFCPDLAMSPDCKTPELLSDMHDFFLTYQRQCGGPLIQKCDYAVFPTCTGSHWFLFIVDIRKSKVMIMDPLRENEDYPLKKMYPLEYYIMEKLIPFMLSYLDPTTFPQPKLMNVKHVKERPRQEGGVDCGVYVCKYIDALCSGIPLNEAIWDPIDDVKTFRYRMAHELRIGKARHLTQLGYQQRVQGF